MEEDFDGSPGGPHQVTGIDSVHTAKSFRVVGGQYGVDTCAQAWIARSHAHTGAVQHPQPRLWHVTVVALLHRPDGILKQEDNMRNVVFGSEVCDRGLREAWVEHRSARAIKTNLTLSTVCNEKQN